MLSRLKNKRKLMWRSPKWIKNGSISAKPSEWITGRRPRRSSSPSNKMDSPSLFSLPTPRSCTRKPSTLTLSRLTMTPCRFLRSFKLLKTIWMLTQTTRCYSLSLSVLGRRPLKNSLQSIMTFGLIQPLRSSSSRAWQKPRTRTRIQVIQMTRSENPRLVDLRKCPIYSLTYFSYI